MLVLLKTGTEGGKSTNQEIEIDHMRECTRRESNYYDLNVSFYEQASQVYVNIFKVSCPIDYIQNQISKWERDPRPLVNKKCNLSTIARSNIFRSRSTTGWAR